MQTPPLIPNSSRLRQVPLIAGFVLLLAVAAGSIGLYLAAHRFNEEVSRSLQIQAAANRLLVLIQDAETGQRGYLLTGNRSYLEPYLAGSAEAPGALDMIEDLTHVDKAQSAIVADLRRLMMAKLAELARTIERAERNDMAGALAIVNNNSGNALMSVIRADIAKIGENENRAMATRRAAAANTRFVLTTTSIAGVAIVLVLAGYVIITAKRATDGLLKARQDLADSNAGLEEIVEARVGDLKVANEEIQRFAYIVSHDLRAPLVNVMGFTSELETARGEILGLLEHVDAHAPELATMDYRTTIETELPEALGFIRASTDKMDRLINAILKLSREGRRDLSPQAIDLAALVRSQGESLKHQFSEKRAELIVDGELPALVSDRLAVEQIFGNLIENAVKYLPPGRAGRIVVRGAMSDGGVRYEIEDNGRGIAAKDFERIFDLFRRSGEQDTPGDGIGLATVRNLARRLGGSVAVASELGKGSTFTVALPLRLRSSVHA